MTPRTNINVLIVDDDAAIRKIFRHTLTKTGYDVVVAEDAQSALKEAWGQRFDLLLTDARPRTASASSHERRRRRLPAPDDLEEPARKALRGRLSRASHDERDVG